MRKYNIDFVASVLAGAKPELEDDRDTDEFGDDPWKVGFDSGSVSAWVDIVDDFALRFRDADPEFDAVEFRRACGVRNV